MAQRFIRFLVPDDPAVLVRVSEQTDATAPDTIRVDDGIMTVGFRGDPPPVTAELALVDGPNGPTWTRDEVLAALPPAPEVLP